MALAPRPPGRTVGGARRGRRLGAEAGETGPGPIASSAASSRPVLRRSGAEVVAVRTDVDTSGSQQTRVPLYGQLQRAALVVRPDRVGLVFPPYWGRAEGLSVPTSGLGVVDLRTDASTRLTQGLWDEAAVKLPMFGTAKPTLLLLFDEAHRVPPLSWRASYQWPHPRLRRREAASAEGLWIDGLLLALHRPDPLARALRDAGAEEITDPDGWLGRRRPQGLDLRTLENLRRTTEAERKAIRSRTARGAAAGLLGALLVAALWGLAAGLGGAGFYEGTEGSFSYIFALCAGPFIGWLVGRSARRTTRPLMFLAGALALAAVVLGEVLSFVVAEWTQSGVLLDPAAAVDMLAARFAPGPDFWPHVVDAVLHLVPPAVLAGGTAGVFRHRPRRPTNPQP
jgi:hypothetical protein